MNTYKITNTTNLVGKRDVKYNKVVDIEYIDNRVKKKIRLKAGDTVFLTVNSLPLSVHRLRIKNLITVIEISNTELNKKMEMIKPKTVKSKTIKKPIILDKYDNEVVVEKKITSKKKNVNKKTTHK